LKVERERLLSLRWAGIEFQFDGPAYANARPRYVASLTEGSPGDHAQLIAGGGDQER